MGLMRRFLIGLCSTLAVVIALESGYLIGMQLR
jgi:hypothetical protein